MKNDTFQLSTGQAHELAMALGRNGWTPEEVKKATSGDFFAQVRLVLLGTAKIVLESFLTLVKEIKIAATGESKTPGCFRDTERYYYRDENLDAWLPRTQKKQAKGKLSVLQLTKTMTFKDMAESILKTAGDIPMLAKLLIERGHTVSLDTIENLINNLINRTVAGNDVGLLINGYANFFFVEDKEGCVSVVYVNRRDGGQWNVNVDRLDRGHVWSAGNRMFARNSCPETL